MITILKHFLNFRDSHYPHQKWLKGITLAVILFFAVREFMFFIPMGILGLIIAFILFAVVTVICVVIYGVIETVLTNIAEKKEHEKDKENFRASGDAVLADLEETRFKIQSMNRQMIFISILMVAAFFAVMLLSYVYIADSQIAAWVFSIASAIPFIFILKTVYKKKAPLDKEYNEIFEKSVVNKTLESVFEVKEFDRGKRIDEKTIHDSQLFSYYEDYWGEDYLAAEYKGTQFVQADTRLTKEEEETYRDGDGDIQKRMVTVNVFAGRFIIVDYDAISNEPVYVRYRRNKKEKTIIETEMQSFNDRFYVEADSPQSALRILTPQVLEGIVTASNKLNCPLSVAFKDDKIYIAVSTENSFVVTNVRGETLVMQQERIKKDVQVILDLIDSIYLKQNGGIHV